MTLHELKELAETLEAEREEINLRQNYENRIAGELHLRKVEAEWKEHARLSAEGRCWCCGKPLAKNLWDWFKVDVCRTNCSY